MIHDPVPPEAWAAEATRIADALEDAAAAVVIGRDAEVTLIAALAIARAQRDGRSVAIGDLVGDLPGLRADEGAPGLLECFRDGVPVSGIGRPLSDHPPIFALPSGNGPIAERWVFESARWTKLVNGFREVDALLLVVALAGTPGLETLVRAMDGVVAVDLPPVMARAWPLLATVDRPEAELPPITPTRPLEFVPEAERERRRARRRRRMAIGSLATVAALGAVGVAIAFGTRDRAAADASAAAPDAAADAAAPEPIATDTITLGPIVNPGDSANASAFAVELVAANTLAGANSRLVIRGESLPAPTVSPVLLGSVGRPWFRALTGAWPERDEAEAYLGALRRRGLVQEDVGRVIGAPLALVLAEGVRRSDAPQEVARWAARGVPAYALMQLDGSARVYAGAFETSGQAALLAKSLRDLGVAPVLAFRTGRAF